MRLTTFTDYSLRVLMYVALKEGELSTIGEMAQQYDISANHLMKVVNFLAQQGDLITQRGKGGGIRLARAPVEVNLGELVRRTEANDTLVECFKIETSQCRLLPACRLKSVLYEAQEAMFDSLARYTLADLIAKPEPMRQVLQIQLSK